jgi:hypothetical protein
MSVRLIPGPYWRNLARAYNGTTQYHSCASGLGLGSNEAKSFGGIWQVTNYTFQRVLMSIGINGAGTSRIFLSTAQTTGNVQCTTTDAGIGSSTAVVAGVSAGTWMLAFGVAYEGNVGREAGCNNTARGTEGTTRATTMLPNTVKIAATPSSSVSLVGACANAWVIRGVLTESQQRQLYLGAHISQVVSPGQLIDAWDFVRTGSIRGMRGHTMDALGAGGTMTLGPTLQQAPRLVRVYVGLASSADTTLAAGVTGTAEVFADLTTAITLAVTPSGSATATGALTTAIEFSASASSVATVSAALTTEVSLAASLTASGATSAGLSTAIEFAAAISTVGSVTADLHTAITLAADAAGSAAVTADLAAAAGLAGALIVEGTVSASLSTGITFAAAPTVTATTTAELTTAVTFAGPAGGTATVSAALLTATSLAADLAGVGTVRGELSTEVTFAGVIAGAAQTTADLETAIFLAGVLAGAAEVTADLLTIILPTYDTIRVGSVRSSQAGASGVRTGQAGASDVRTSGSGAAGVRTAYD